MLSHAILIAREDGDDGCALLTTLTETVACICIVAIYITGRHYGFVFVN